nr:response regulator [bacterium]
GSAVQLSTSLMNIVTNAVEAMPGGGKVRISTANKYIDLETRHLDSISEGEFAVLTIGDEGIGISQEDQERIFEPFYTKKKMGRSGTGLGMAVVWGAVKDHGGFIDLQSEPGRGTTFRLYSPASREPRSEQPPLLAPASYQGQGELILVVDDVEQQRRITTGMLSELGYQVEAVASGEEAVEFLRERKVDLLLLDMIMEPGIDGLETYRRSLEVQPEQRSIIVSGFSANDRVKAAQELGAGEYIRKPFTMERIAQAVKQALEK